MGNSKATIDSVTFTAEEILSRILALLKKNGYALTALDYGAFYSFLKWAKIRKQNLGHISWECPCYLRFFEVFWAGKIVFTYQGSDDVPNWWNRKHEETLRISFDQTDNKIEFDAEATIKGTEINVAYRKSTEEEVTIINIKNEGYFPDKIKVTVKQEYELYVEGPVKNLRDQENKKIKDYQEKEIKKGQEKKENEKTWLTISDIEFLDYINRGFDYKHLSTIFKVTPSQVLRRKKRIEKDSRLIAFILAK